jgi:branched-chain amino acid transport system substrate-binding protein
LSLSVLVASGCGSRDEGDQQAAPGEKTEAAPATPAPDASTGGEQAPAAVSATPSAPVPETPGPAAPAGQTPSQAGAPAKAAAPSAKAGSAAGPAPAAQSGTAGRADAAAPAPGPVPGNPPDPVPGDPGAGPKSEIRLGSIGAGSGPIGAAMQSIVDGAKAWSQDVNARGGLNGHPVRVIFVDDSGDPAAGLALARRLVEQDKIHAFYATHAPTTEEAYVRYAEDKHVPIIGTCGCSNVVDTSPMIFHVGPGSPGGATWAHVLQFTALTDKRKAALLYCREVSVCPLLAAGVRQASKQADFQVVYEAQISLAQPDYTAEMLAARNVGADVVILISDNATAVRVARSAHRQDYTPVISIQQSANEDSFLSLGKEDVDGALVSAVVPDYANSPKLADYRKAMARFVPGGRRGSFSAQTWAAGKLLEVIAAGFPADVSSADILTGLHALRGETLGGLVPPMTFAPGRGHGDVNQCIIPSRVEGGKFVYPFGEQFSCPPGFKPYGT